MLSKLLTVHTPLALKKWRLVDSPHDLIVQEHRCPAGRDSCCYLCCFQKASHPPLNTNRLLPRSHALENSGSENLESIWGKTKMEGHQEKRSLAITEAFTQAIPGKSQVTGKDAGTGTKRTEQELRS